MLGLMRGIGQTPRFALSSRQYKNVLIFGSSNVGASAFNDSAIFTNQIDTFDSDMLKLDHSNELRQFSTPVNNDYGVNTYNHVNEEMYYGISESLITGLRAATSAKIAVCPAFQSSTSVAYALSANTKGWFKSRNASNPFDTTRQYGQVITRAKALMDLTGETIDVVYLSDAGRDATFASGGTPAAVVSAYKEGIANLKADLGLTAETKFILPNIGYTPLNIGVYPNWNNIRTAIQNEAGFGDDVFVINPATDAEFTGTLESNVQFEYTTTNITGLWTIGETIVGATSGAIGKLSSFRNSNPTNIWIEEKPNNGGFVNGELVTGQISGQTANVTVSAASPATVHYNTGFLNQMGSVAAGLLNN